MGDLFFSTVFFHPFNDEAVIPIFASAPYWAIVMEITTGSEYGLNGSIRLTRPMGEGRI
ncbi:MAG: hypothetical protein U9N31_08455 [Candidatus Marinimicrobia bacterium]|nr:hypothetical protein [Candidatus Neomarinimicrobiota bacterium]